MSKNLRVILPRDDAEDLIGKPESRCQIVASHGPLYPVGRKHIAEGGWL